MLADAKDVQIVGEASDAREAIQTAASLKPDVILLDIRMPGMNGLQLLRRMREQLPDVKVVILTNYGEEQFLLEAFRIGASGYLLKSAGRAELLEAIKAARLGKRSLSPQLMDSVLEEFATLSRKYAKDQFGLSGKEIELLKLVSEGDTNEEIANKMYWSKTTVKRKLSDVYLKLNAGDRAQAVAIAMRHGLI
jgi:DNA-binding NarL/FixJ family response regulator